MHLVSKHYDKRNGIFRILVNQKAIGMIISIGYDVVEHKAVKQLKWDIDHTLKKRIFSSEEIGLYEGSPKVSFLAGRFAVKEAVLKCLGTGMVDRLSLINIETLRSESGRPLLKITGEVENLAKTLLIDTWHVSITHTDSSSFAFVLAERLIF